MQKVDNGHLFLQERQEMILSLLKKEHKVMVPYLCECFSVSPATIRSDLNEMESRGLLTRTHGGAILNTKSGQEKVTNQKVGLNRSEKRLIGLAAAEMVQDGDVIAVDTGTTAMEFVRAITRRKNLTVVTNDLNIAGVLEEQSDATIVFIGGVIRRGFHCSVGPLAIKGMEGLGVDKCFLATNGLTPEFGISTPDMGHAEVKRKMVQIASQVIVMCDSSKIGSSSFCQVVPLSQVDVIITDEGIGVKMRQALEDREVIVKVCKA